MTVMRWKSVAAAATVAVLALSACGDDEESSTGSSGSGGSTAANGSSTTPSSGGVEQATIDLGVEYTGGKAGKADTSLTPVTIGFTTQLGGTPSFPEQVAAADATVSFINEHLGGIDGHPLKLDKCSIQSEEDGQKCAAQFLGNKVPLVNQALAVIGNASLYKTIDNKVPVLVGTTSTGPDSASPGVYSFTGGGPAVIYAMSKDTANLKAKYTALVSVGNPGGKFTMEKIAVPALDQLGVKHGKTVYYDDTATTPDIVSAVQAAGGSKADVIFFDPSGPQQCTSLFQALKQLGIAKPVVATPICNAPSFVDATGAGPKDWRLWGFGENPRVTADPQVKAYNNIMDAYGQSKFKYTGFANSTTRDMLTVAKFGNTLGADNITPEALRKEILAFRGPAFMVPGEQNCAEPLDPATQSICGRESGGSLFTDSWESIPAITNELKSGT